MDSISPLILLSSIIILFIVVHLCYRYQSGRIQKHSTISTVEAFSSGSMPRITSSQDVDLHYTSDIYDEFYSEVYNTLFHSNMKNNWECMWIYQEYLKKWESDTPIHVLDVGCGQGYHMKIFSEYFKLPIDGMDQSKWMIKKARKNCPDCTFYHHDFEIPDIFTSPKYTHIICLFFTIYYAKNISTFFRNMAQWLYPDGFLFVHVVRRDRFDPILERSSSLIPLYDPQKHSKTRMTQTTLHFKEFTYDADWQFRGKKADFLEKFRFKHEPFVRKQTHHFHMWDISEIKSAAKMEGLKMLKAFDLAMSGMDYNYILVFQRKDRI